MARTTQDVEDVGAVVIEIGANLAAAIGMVAICLMFAALALADALKRRK